VTDKPLDVVPDELVDREAEEDVLGCVFAAMFALDANPQREDARRILDEFARFDTTWLSCADVRRVAVAMQSAQRAAGVPAPLVVRDELRRAGRHEELRGLLPALVTRSGAVIAGWSYYVARVGDVCAKRRAYLAHVNAAVDLIADSANR
jgi:hypothetical protein